MTKIIVSENGMNQEASDIMQQMRKIETIKEGIKSVRAKLDRDISTKSGIDRRLKRTYEECGEYISVGNVMANVIREAAELYCKCENGIVGKCEQSGGKESNNNSEWADLMEFINNPYHGTFFSRFNISTEIVRELDFGSVLLISSSKGISDALSKFLGKDYEVEIIKKNLAKILQSMEGQTSADKVPEEVKLIVKTIKDGGKLIPEFADKYGEIIEGVGDVSKLLKAGEGGVEYLEYVLTDYAESIETLEMLSQTGIGNPKAEAAIDSLIEMYRNKFLGSAIKGKDYLLEMLGNKGAEAVVEAATGGLYKYVELGKDVLYEFSGLNDRAGALESIMANAQLEAEISQGYYAAIENLSSGNVTEASVTEAQRMFDLYKATKISQYESALELVEYAPWKYDNISAAEIRSDLELLKSLEMNTESIIRVNSNSSISIGSSGRGHGGGGGGSFGGGEMGGR